MKERKREIETNRKKRDNTKMAIRRKENQKINKFN